jgi:hypothetical protein
MRQSFPGKAAMVAVLLSASALNVNAQKIQEQELKTNVAEISNPLRQLINLKPVTFQFDTSKFNHLKLPTGSQYGFIANEVKNEFPNIVKETGKVYTAGKNNSKVARYEEVQTESLIPVLVAAIKEQQIQIEQLKKELSQLKQHAK